MCTNSAYKYLCTLTLANTLL
uniref:Uncharacterized protein n=1 Tax=Arundo donax TaxID=35708 RepID=A0A0A9H0N9_ARUDO